MHFLYLIIKHLFVGDILNVINIFNKELKKCSKSGDVPVSAFLILNGKVIAKAHNTKEKCHNPFNHAEILVIKKACKKLKRNNLSDCEIYSTLEPCNMCKSLINSVKIRNSYYLLKKLDYKSDFNTNFTELSDFQQYKNEYKKELHNFFNSLKK